MVILIAAGCGGGGGGGPAVDNGVVDGGNNNGGGGTVDDGGGDGGGGVVPDTTKPTVTFTAPSNGSSYQADPAKLPSSVSARYSDDTDIVPGSFTATFNFGGITFNIASLFSAGLTTSTATPSSSPLYWTPISSYNMTNLAAGAFLGLFGVSSGSTGVLNLIDVDTQRDILVAAATSRNALVIFNASSGTVNQEIALPSMPAVVRTCPAYGKVYVAFSSLDSVYSYNISTGATEAILSMGSVPMTMAMNQTASIAYVIFSNSTAIKTIDCSDNAISSGTLQNIPQRITTDEANPGQLFYAGGIGVDKGIYSWTASAETKLASLSALPEDIVYNSASNRFFIADYANNIVQAYNASTGALITNINVGNQPFSLENAASVGKVFVLNKGSDSVSVINAATAAIESTLALGADPVALVSDNENGTLYVLKNIWQISTSQTGTLTASIKDSAGNMGTASINITVTPVSSGGPENPTTPDG